MSWETIKEMQNLGQGLGDVIDAIVSKNKADKQSQQNAASFQSLKNATAGQYGIPTAEDLQTAGQNLASAQEQFKPVAERWDDMLKFNPDNPVQSIVNQPQPVTLDPNSPTYRNDLNALQKKKWENDQAARDQAEKNKNDAFRKLHQPTINNLNTARRTLEQKKGQVNDYNNLTPEHWSDLFKINLGDRKMDNQEARVDAGGYTFAQQVDDLKQLGPIAENALLLARDDPKNPDIYDKYKRAVELYNESGKSLGKQIPLIPSAQFKPLTPAEKSSLEMLKDSEILPALIKYIQERRKK